MSIKNDISSLFAQILAEHDGNKAAAAASLDVNTVTFWHWMNGTRNPAESLFKAIDKAGGKLIGPGISEHKTDKSDVTKIAELKKEITALQRALLERDLQIKELEKYKYKWEGHIEEEEAKARALVQAQNFRHPEKKRGDDIFAIDKAAENNGDPVSSAGRCRHTAHGAAEGDDAIE